MPINFGDLRRSPQLEWALLACRNMTRIFNEATKFQSSDKFMFTHDTLAKQASETHFQKQRSQSQFSEIQILFSCFSSVRWSETASQEHLLLSFASTPAESMRDPTPAPSPALARRCEDGAHSYLCPSWEDCDLLLQSHGSSCSSEKCHCHQLSSN